VDFSALSEQWMRAVCAHDVARVVRTYARNGVLVGTVAQRIKVGRADIKLYFDRFLAKNGVRGRFDSHLIQPYDGWGIHSGTYTFVWVEGGRSVVVPARYTFVWTDTPEGWRIANHHSSALPE